MAIKDKLILRPDPAKLYLVAIGESAVVGVVAAGVAYLLLGQLAPSFFAVPAIGIAVGLLVFFKLRLPTDHTFVELNRKAIRFVEPQQEQVIAWSDISRFTLQEGIVEDRQGRKRVARHYLAARILGAGNPAQDKDEPTQSGSEDLRISIDKYISNHRYSKRGADEEAACSSPERFADTVNAWRDFALNIEIGGIPTPKVQVDDNHVTEFMQKIFVKLNT